ncbi:hypothetical protein FRC08_008626 [Ceratobasidium sp. 394]|nr:hypothetical protein FRC08_008626 [Ceratobasidium sp. 394]
MSNPPAYPQPPKPGTYRITSVATKTTVLQVLDFNRSRVASYKWADTPNQHWFIQYSGRGYKIKNRQHGVYLAASTNKSGTIVGTSLTPTVWNLMRTHAGFAIQYGEADLFIDLHYGFPNDGNVVMLWGSGDLPERRRWMFDRISDDTGGEIVDTNKDEIDHLKQQLEMKDAQLALQAEELSKLKDQLLAEKDRTIATLTGGLHQLGGLGKANRETVDELGFEETEEIE